jgi:hypothetical protein
LPLYKKQRDDLQTQSGVVPQKKRLMAAAQPGMQTDRAEMALS